MQNKYIELGRVIESLKTWADDLEGYSKSEYVQNREQIHQDISKAEELQKEIITICMDIEGRDINRMDLRKKAQDQKNKTMDKMAKVREELPNLISTIRSKENNFGTITESDEGPSSRNRGVSTSSLSQDFQILNLQKNEEFLNQRRKDLIEIKQTAAQVKDLTEAMKIEVHQQGEVLNSIENNVIDVQSNVEKANEEIKQANELTKKNRNKIICFSVMAFILACTIIGLILYFTVFKKSS